MLAEDKKDHAHHKDAQGKSQKKDQAQQDVDNVIWEGFDYLREWMQYVKMSYEDSEQEKDKRFHLDMRMKIRKQLNT